MNYRVDRQIDKLKGDLDDWVSRLERIASGLVN